jgi:hypothetical protein
MMHILRIKHDLALKIILQTSMPILFEIVTSPYCQHKSAIFLQVQGQVVDPNLLLGAPSLITPVPPIVICTFTITQIVFDLPNTLVVRLWHALINTSMNNTKTGRHGREKISIY